MSRTNLTRIALCIVLVAASLKTLKNGWHGGSMSDFKVYETAATLVRKHLSSKIYDGADSGADPQTRLAPPEGEFAKQARSIGISRVMLYVYPPLLADLMVPFTFVSNRYVASLWIAFNVVLLASFDVLMIRLLKIPWKSPAALAILLGTVTFNPILECLSWGQIVIILLYLWTLSALCYARGWQTASAVLLALATAIKLTPILAVIPMLLWREWRWIKAYTVSLFALLAAAVFINGAHTVQDCFLHVLPLMSSGYPSEVNFTSISGFGLIYEAHRSVNTQYGTSVAIPRTMLLFAKTINLLCLAPAVALLLKRRSQLGPDERILVLALFAMLSVVISPVSWQHAYTVCLLGFVLLWAEALQAHTSKAYLFLLTITSLECNWFVLTFTLRPFLYGLLRASSTFIPIALLLILISYRLAALSKPSALHKELSQTTLASV